MRTAIFAFSTLAALVPTWADAQPAFLRERAAEVLTEARPFTPEWKDARLAQRAFPLFRPDRKAIAYYEFPVIAGAPAAPAGSIVLATARHDHPVVQWGSRGNPLVERLRREAANSRKAPVRFYLLDTTSFAAEDANGDLVARVGTPAIPTRPAAWREFKRTYGKTRAPFQRQLDLDSAPDWAYWEKPKATREASCSPWSTVFAGSDDDQPIYGSIGPSQPPNDSACFSGWGAASWAMLFAWIDIRAAKGDAAWPGQPWGQIVCDAATPAPLNPNTAQPCGAEAWRMIWEIRNDLQTTCSNDYPENPPERMWRASLFLERKLGEVIWNLTTESTMWRIPKDWMTDKAEAVIRSRRPVIIQLNWFSDHYHLAYAVRTRNCGDDQLREMKINEGNWGDLRWTSASTSFVGHVTSRAGAYWQPCRSSSNPCDPGLVCYQDRCRRLPAEGEPCFTSGDLPQCAITLQCKEGICKRRQDAGRCAECVPGESNCNESGCPLNHECTDGPNPICIKPGSTPP